MSRRTVTALVHLYARDEGGRSGPLLSGYRSLLRFEGSDVDLGFELELDHTVDPGGLAPGASGTSRVSLWASERLPSLFAGKQFELREGARVIGRGTIIDPGVG
jgi:translation elongation factor EF-Tu-like GTPase